jgi:hypothetical protein
MSLVTICVIGENVNCATFLISNWAIRIKILTRGGTPVAQACNPRHYGGRDQED